MSDLIFSDSFINGEFYQTNSRFSVDDPATEQSIVDVSDMPLTEMVSLDRSPQSDAPHVLLPHPVAIIHNFVDYDILIIA